jgi:predicted 3-demethylubiquinone-9 3-methyltransferase (glyoxalase superfamily)
MKVTQHLWFEKDMEAALRFYISLIPGSSLDFLSTTPADSPSGPAGTVKIAAFTLGDQRYRAIEAGPFDPQSRNFSIMVECDTQEEVDRLWDALTTGGKGIACGWLTDRWGITWQITPKRLLDFVSDSGRAKGKRVMEAMMKMVKIDIAALEAAARAG